MNAKTLSRRQRWLRRLLIALSALLLLWLVAWLGVPPLLKWQLQKRGSEWLGREVTVERVDFRPWSLALTLEGLRVAAAVPGQAPQLSFARLSVDAELQSLFRLAPVIDSLRLEQPRLTLRHLGEGRYDVDDILQRLQPDPAAPPAEPAQFALFNIALSDGEVVFADDAAGVTHQLTGLNIGVPFLSNLPSRREVVTEPRLAFVLNGSAFDSQASTTPFAETRSTDARVDIPALDLAPYLPYWPAQWPVRLQAGTLHLALRLDFEQQDQPRLALSGTAALSGLRVAEHGPGTEGAALLSWDRLAVEINRAEPLARRADLARVGLSAPRLHLARDAQGRLNLQRVADAFAAVAAPADAQAGTGTEAPATPWQVSVARLELDGGGVQWLDASVRPAADLALEALEVQAQDLRWPMAAPVPFQASARLGETPLTLQGEATAAEAQAELSVGKLALSTFAPYLASVLVPEVGGQLEARLQARWRAADGQQPMALSVGLPDLRFDGLRVGPARRALASLAALQVRDAQLDLAERRVEVGKVLARNLRAGVQRAGDGRWQVQDWLRSTPAAAAADRSPATEAPPWQVTLADVELDGGTVTLEDRLPPRPVHLALSQLRLQVKNLRPLADKPPDMPVSLRLRLGAAQAGAGEPGQLSVSGSLRLPAGPGAQGLALKTRVQAERLPVHLLEPYFGDALNLELLRADVGYQGALDVAMSAAGLTLALDGQAAVEELRASTLEPAEDLLAWNSLQVRGLRLAMAPGEATRVSVEQTVLSDYFARVIIDETGRINLQGLVKEKEGGDGDAAAATPAGAQPVAAAPAPRPDIRFGPISLVNGRVLFSDRFIRPNYSANLSEVSGGLSAFSSVPAGGAPAMADLTLRGRAEGTATLEVDGQLNPLAQPLALDIRGRVRNLELPPLSPYSVKYAGYGIERGKLSVDVAYKVEPDGRLTASNQIVLNQLDFGERVAGSEAPNLPVKLAVALLADRNGVIDINLPISGSLSDPEFRVGPLIFRLILNLIGKAVTAPFSLIASALGGGDGQEMSQIGFAAGMAQLDDAGRQRLDTVAQALQNRPALQVTVVGHADLEAERSAYQRARLDQQVLAEKRRAMARAGATPPEQGLVVAPEEYPALLKEVYRRADIPKPRNVIGLAKDIPQAEMEALLLAAVPVTPDLLRELAVARAMAVRDYLAGRELAQERLFLGAPQLGRKGEDWKPQAELQLAPR